MEKANKIQAIDVDEALYRLESYKDSLEEGDLDYHLDQISSSLKRNFEWISPNALQDDIIREVNRTIGFSIKAYLDTVTLMGILSRNIKALSKLTDNQEFSKYEIKSVSLDEMKQMIFYIMEEGLTEDYMREEYQNEEYQKFLKFEESLYDEKSPYNFVYKMFKYLEELVLKQK